MTLTVKHEKQRSGQSVPFPGPQSSVQTGGNDGTHAKRSREESALLSPLKSYGDDYGQSQNAIDLPAQREKERYHVRTSGRRPRSLSQGTKVINGIEGPKPPFSQGHDGLGNMDYNGIGSGAMGNKNVNTRQHGDVSHGGRPRYLSQFGRLRDRPTSVTPATFRLHGKRSSSLTPSPGNDERATTHQLRLENPERCVDDAWLPYLLDILRRKGQKSIKEVVGFTTVNVVVNILHTKDYSYIPYRLKNTCDHENLMELLLFLLDHKLLFATEDVYCKARRLVVKLGMEVATIPNSLILDDNKITLEGCHSFEFGGQADVYMAMYQGSKVAMKRIRSSSINKDFCREALVWRMVSHRCILPLIGIYIDSSRFFISLVSPFMKNGTLRDWRKTANPTASTSQRLVLAVAEGLQYLHEQGFIHGDTRGSNVLLNDNLEVKIADLGLAKHSDGTGTEDHMMSIRFSAPELLGNIGETEDQDGLITRTREMDVYAFACLYYETHFGEAPFSKRSIFYVGMSVAIGRRPKRHLDPPLDDKAWGLIEKCWHQEPAQRPTMNEVVRIMGLWN